MEGCVAQKTPVKNFNGYIMCFHRKNTPRISIKVCELSCQLKRECKEYRIFSEMQALKNKSLN